MAQIFVFGRVTADLTLKESINHTPYICFNLAENIGYGDKRRTQYYQVWAWGTDTSRLIRMGVKEGSLIWLAGSQELVNSTEKNGETKTMNLKIALDNWGFVPTRQSSPPNPGFPKESETIAETGKLDGDREFLPE